MTDNGTPTQNGSDDRLTGLYPVSKEFTDTSAYPPTVTQVFVDAARDGYRDVVFFDAEGDVVARSNRAEHRIEAALRDGEHYHAAVRRPA